MFYESWKIHMAEFCGEKGKSKLPAVLSRVIYDRYERGEAQATFAFYEKHHSSIFTISSDFVTGNKLYRNLMSSIKYFESVIYEDGGNKVKCFLSQHSEPSLLLFPYPILKFLDKSTFFYQTAGEKENEGEVPNSHLYFSDSIFSLIYGEKKNGFINLNVLKSERAQQIDIITKAIVNSGYVVTSSKDLFNRIIRELYPDMNEGVQREIWAVVNDIAQPEIPE